jgi:hypothetical protein
MEPGGTEDLASYEAWLRLGGRELIDCRAHHLWKRDVLGIEDREWTRWHDDLRGRGTQPTWRRLIQTLLAFKNEPTNLDAVYEYQKYKLGRLDGETAVVDLGALHAPNLRTIVDRDSFRNDRVALLHSRLLEHRPVFAICYGYGFADQYARVIGADFDSEGFAWCGPPLCVLTPGPTSRPPSPAAKPSWWIEKGHQMRAIIDARNASATL